MRDHDVVGTGERLFLAGEYEALLDYLDAIPDTVWQHLDEADRAYLSRASHIASMSVPPKKQARSEALAHSQSVR